MAAVIAAADVASRLKATSPRRRASSSRFGVGSSVRSAAMLRALPPAGYFLGAAGAAGAAGPGLVPGAGLAPAPPPAAPAADIICCMSAA